MLDKFGSDAVEDFRLRVPLKLHKYQKSIVSPLPFPPLSTSPQQTQPIIPTTNSFSNISTYNESQLREEIIILVPEAARVLKINEHYKYIIFSVITRCNVFFR